jgi:hypothetical protein
MKSFKKRKRKKRRHFGLRSSPPPPPLSASLPFVVGLLLPVFGRCPFVSPTGSHTMKLRKYWRLVKKRSMDK